MKRLLIILITGLLLAGTAKGQQTIQFSQYIFNGLSVNPAYAGYKENWYVNMAYRKQWSGLEGSPQTAMLGIDGLTKNRDKRVGLGLMIVSDRLGPQESLSVFGNYSYRLPLNLEDTRRLCFGLGAGFTQYSLDGSALQLIEGNDPVPPSGKASTIVPDVRFGIYYYTPTFYIGGSVLDLLSSRTDPDRYSFEGHEFNTTKRVRHMYLTFGGLINLKKGTQLKPSVMIKEDFAGPTNLDLTMMLMLKERFWVGGSWRTGVNLWRTVDLIDKDNLQRSLSEADALSAIIEFYISERLRIGYSYDYSLSELSNYENGSHEISVGITFPSKVDDQRILSPRYF